MLENESEEKCFINFVKFVMATHSNRFLQNLIPFKTMKNRQNRTAWIKNSHSHLPQGLRTKPGFKSFMEPEENEFVNRISEEMLPFESA